MKIKIKYVVVSLLFAGICHQQVFAQATTSENAEPFSSTKAPLISSSETSLLNAIKQARSMLYDQLALDKTKKLPTTTVTSTDAPVPVTLAIWNEQTNETFLLKVIKSKSSVKITDGSNYTIKLKRNNGVNSDFEIAGKPELHVVALRHPIYISIGTKRHPRYKLEDVVYVPYSDDIATPEVVTAGMNYLDNNIKAVYDELRYNQVKSRAYAGKLLADVIDPALVKSIIAIEHTSSATLKKGEAGEYLDELFVILAANENQAYAFSRSSARAFGLVQFIPSTYGQLRKIRPELILPADFEQGMSDPYMAIKAEIGLLDYNLEFLPKNIREQYMTDTKNLGSYLAAIYNGGPSRVRKAISVWGEDWAENHVAMVARLKQEAKSVKAEIAKIDKQLKQKKIDPALARSLKQDKTELQIQVKELTDKYTKGSNYSLKPETIQYVEKYFLVYDTLSDPSFSALSLNQQSSEVAISTK